MNHDLYFDESLFDDGFSFRNYKIIVVNNRADKMLATRLKSSSRILDHTCDELKKNRSDIDHDSIVNINPKVPCIGTNVYTLNSRNKRIAISLPYNPIVVTIKTDSDDTFRKLDINEYADIIDDGDATMHKFDINDDLTPLESAIMVKYLALKHKIIISIKLFLYIHKYPVDHRRWFDLDDTIGIIETQNYELLLDLRPINVPSLTNISGPELLLV
jgi:hypothetical protein